MVADLNSQSDSSPELLDLNQRLFTNSKLSFRKEKEGTVLFVNGKYSSFVTKDTATLLLKLKDKSFSVAEINNEYQLNVNDMVTFFSNLFKQKVIIKQI